MSESSLEQRISECGRQMAIAAVPAFRTGGKLHPPTLIAACARMAGSYLFRSFKLPSNGASPGQVVLSAEASEQTPLLLRTCSAILASLGTKIGQSPQLPLIDDKLAPRQDFLATQQTLERVFAPLVSRYGLDHRAAARAAAVATTMVVQTFAKHLEPDRGFGVAAVCFTEGCRTVPAELPEGGSAA